MKKIPLLLVFIAMAAICQAQISWGLYSQTFSSNEPDGPQLIAAIPRGNNAFWSINSPSVFKNSLEENKAFIAGRSKFIALTSFDTEAAHFFVRNVGNENNPQLEYRVLLDGKETINDWAAVNKPAPDSVKSTSTIRDLMYIGSYKADMGHYLVVDLRKKDGGIVNSAVVAWRPIRPMLFNIYTGNDLNGFLHRLSHPNGYRMTEAERQKWRSQYSSDKLDPVTSLPNKLVVNAKDNSVIFSLRADIREKEQVEYELVKDKKVVRSWGANDFDNNFIWLKDLAPGDYVLRIRYAVQPGNTLEYNFEVKPPPGPTTAYVIGISSLIAAFLALMIVMMLYLRQKRKAKKESLQRERTELEMKGLKSQLNPHFVFNSLNSIQGLVNTGKIRESNEYIALFAKMMRDTLNLSELNEAPLQQEIDYLDTYLRLEQLRFNFAYDIFVDPSLRTGEVNFPTLLLQPLVENAVRHGIATIKNGQINLCFTNENGDLAVAIRDNGKGFVENAGHEGYGLRLTKRRVRLLNETAGTQQVTMNVTSNEKEGAQIQLIFKAWAS